MSLQEAADQLELQAPTDDDSNCKEVKAKLSVLSQKLRILVNVCHVYATRLSRALGIESPTSLTPEEIEEEEEGSVMPTLSDEVRLPPAFEPKCAARAMFVQAPYKKSYTIFVGLFFRNWAFSFFFSSVVAFELNKPFFFCPAAAA